MPVLHLSLRSLNMNLHAPSGMFPSDRMQHAFVTSKTKKHLVQGCKNAVAAAWPKTWSARMFFTVYTSCIWMLYGSGSWYLQTYRTLAYLSKIKLLRVT